jgi:hypothetical protein
MIDEGGDIEPGRIVKSAGNVADGDDLAPRLMEKLSCK